MSRYRRPCLDSYLFYKVTEIKLIEKDLSYLRQNKEKAGQLRADLAETETRYVASKETVEKIVEKLDPIQVNLCIKFKTKNE